MRIKLKKNETELAGNEKDEKEEEAEEGRFLGYLKGLRDERFGGAFWPKPRKPQENWLCSKSRALQL